MNQKGVTSIWGAFLVLFLVMHMLLPQGVMHAAQKTDTSAALSATQIGEVIKINGTTASQDPTYVPLLVTDQKGQILFVQDIAGGGKPFSLEFGKPDWAEEGTAKVTLYSVDPITASFPITGPKPPDKKKLELSVRIVGEDGEEIFPKTVVKLSKGSSAYSLLRYVCTENDLDYEVVDLDGDGNDVYIKSIKGLAEFDRGPGSGWVYLVNGVQPPMPVDRYKLDNKDDVEFIYTTDFGRTQGGTNTESKLSGLYRTSAVAEIENALYHIGLVDTVEDIVNVIDEMLVNLAEYDIEKQKTFIPDVAQVLQAAYEKAGMLKKEDVQTKASNDLLLQGLTRMMVTEVLDDQAEVLEKLSERLAQSNLYKGLLLDLKPTVLVPIPEKSFARWQLKVEPEAWQEIRSRSSKISMIKGDWRTDMLPQRDVNGQVPLLLSLTMYDEKTQTDQISNLNSEVVPFTSSYRLTLSDQGAAAFAFRWPTETQQEELLPVLYFRTAETEPWGIQSTLVQPDADLQYVKGHFRGNGDLFVAGVPKPQFQDVAALPKAYDWAKEPIASLAALGIIQGRSAEQFDWQAHLKRSEAILLISRLTGKTVQTEGIPDFAANTAKPINRAELAWLLANAAESTGSKSVDAPHIFGDQQMIPDWAVQPIAFATGQKWLQGRTDGRFDPLAPLTRAEAVVALYRMMSLEPEVAVK